MVGLTMLSKHSAKLEKEAASQIVRSEAARFKESINV